MTFSECSFVTEKKLQLALKDCEVNLYKSSAEGRVLLELQEARLEDLIKKFMEPLTACFQKEQPNRVTSEDHSHPSDEMYTVCKLLENANENLRQQYSINQEQTVKMEQMKEEMESLKKELEELHQAKLSSEAQLEEQRSTILTADLKEAEYNMEDTSSPAESLEKSLQERKDSESASRNKVEELESRIPKKKKRKWFRRLFCWLRPDHQ